MRVFLHIPITDAQAHRVVFLLDGSPNCAEAHTLKNMVLSNRLIRTL
jgi:hypothetical protein